MLSYLICPNEDHGLGGIVLWVYSECIEAHALNVDFSHFPKEGRLKTDVQLEKSTNNV